MNIPNNTRFGTCWNPRPVVITLLFVIHGVLGLRTIGAMSPTYDEALHLYAGYAALKKDAYTVNIAHSPPLAQMWSALPLLPFDLSVPLEVSHGVLVVESEGDAYI